MKVLFLNHNQERFGTYYRCFSLGKALAKRNIDVTMICASGKNLDILIRKQEINRHFTIITMPRIKYHKFFTGQILRLILTVPFVLFCDYDILHAFTVAQPQIGIPALLAKWVRKKPLIVDWDDLWGGGFGEEHAQIVGKVFFFFERFVPQYADKITYVSDYLGTELKKLGLIDKSVKVPNGIDRSDIRIIPRDRAIKKLNLETDTKYIVSVGNTYFPQGLKVLFEAINSISEKRHDVRLIMVGYLDIHDSLRPLLSSIRHLVITPGFVPYETMRLYLSAADVLVLPMADNLIEKARFPVRLAEYLASGTPVVSNAVGEVREILSKFHCGLMSSPSDIEGFAQNIQTALDDQAISDTLGKRGMHVARSQMDWSILTQRLIRHYHTIYHG